MAYKRVRLMRAELPYYSWQHRLRTREGQEQRQHEVATWRGLLVSLAYNLAPDEKLEVWSPLNEDEMGLAELQVGPDEIRQDNLVRIEVRRIGMHAVVAIGRRYARFNQMTKLGLKKTDADAILSAARAQVEAAHAATAREQAYRQTQQDLTTQVEAALGFKTHGEYGDQEARQASRFRSIQPIQQDGAPGCYVKVEERLTIEQTLRLRALLRDFETEQAAGAQLQAEQQEVQ